MQQFIKASTQRIVAQLFQHGTHGFDFFRLVPEVVFERKQVIRLHFRVSVQPCRRLCDTSETEEFAVGNRDTLAAQFAQYIVHQFVDRRRNDNGFHLGLHGVQFVQCDGCRHCAKLRILLFVQDFQPCLAFLDVVRHHFELKAVIQRRENLFFLVAEIRNFIRRGEERNHRNLHGHALVCVAFFIQNGQQRVQNTVTGLKNLVQKDDMRIRNFALGNGRRRASGQERQTFLVLLHSLGKLF